MLKFLRTILEPLEPLFCEIAKGSFSAKEEVLHLLSREDPHTIHIGASKVAETYRQNAEKVWSEFLCKIALDKFYWKPGGASVTSYSRTILVNICLDIVREENSQKRKSFLSLDQMEEEFSAPQIDGTQLESLQEEIHQAFVFLSTREKVLMKFCYWEWLGFPWKQDEREWLENTGWNPEELLEVLKEEAGKEGNLYSIRQALEKHLKIKRNTIDQNLRRAKKRLASILKIHSLEKGKN